MNTFLEGAFKFILEVLQMKETYIVTFIVFAIIVAVVCAPIFAKIGKFAIMLMFGVFVLYGSGIISKKDIVQVATASINTVKLEQPKKSFFLKRWFRKTILRKKDKDVIVYGHVNKNR